MLVSVSHNIFHGTLDYIVNQFEKCILYASFQAS